MKTQWLSPEKLDELKNERLKIIIKHVYENVPYYRTIFNEHGLKPNDIQTKEESLPILTKGYVRKHFKELIAQKILEKYKLILILRYTSGSTGESLDYYLDKDLLALINATVWRYWRWCGLNFGEKIEVFRGDL